MNFCLIRGAQRILVCGHFLFHVLPNWSGIKILFVAQCTFRLYFVYINYQRNLEILYQIRVLPGQLWYVSFLIPLMFQTRFPDVMNSFQIVRWYTYTCSNIKLKALKLVLLKLITMTTNAEYVAPRAEEQFKLITHCR